VTINQAVVVVGMVVAVVEQVSGIALRQIVVAVAVVEQVEFLVL